MTDKRNKIALHLNDDTHLAIKKWAGYQGTTMPKLAQALLEDMQPMLEQLIVAYEDIMSGENKQEVLDKMLANTLNLANERFEDTINDDK
jgi:hypothetical protein